MRASQGPAKGILILLAIAGLMIVGLMALEGKFTPKRPAVDKIVFVSDRGGRPNVWMMNTDGSSPAMLSSGSHVDTSPSWSADGARIVFTSERDGLAQVCTMQAMRRDDPQQLTVGTGVKLRPVFSPEGDTIAYIQQGRVYTSNLDGSNIEPILPPVEGAAGVESATPGVKSPYINVDWSSDSKSLAAVEQVDEIQTARAVMDLHSSDHETASVDITDLDGRPLAGNRVSVKWAPKGRKIAVSVAAKSKGVLVVRDYDGDALTIVTADAVPGRAAWSPDTGRIAFEVLRYQEGKAYSQSGLAVADVESGEYRMVAKGDVTGPTWTADGKKVIFTKADKNGFRDIWSVNPDGSGARNLTAGRGDNYDAAASPTRAR